MCGRERVLDVDGAVYKKILPVHIYHSTKIDWLHVTYMIAQIDQ